MTRETLEKIEGTIYKSTLERKKHDLKHLEDMGLVKDAKGIRCSIAGYLQALRDCGIITESDFRKLFCYYGTI
jgi:hypothetical protein